jgi:hypothetical protein
LENVFIFRTDKIKKPSEFNSNQIHQTLADYVANYFEKRFQSKTMAIEMGYNLHDACQRYRNSEQINLFWGIITGQIEELVYHHQMRSIGQLLQHLIKMKTYFSLQYQSSSSPKARKAIVSEPSSPLSVIDNHRLSSLSLFSIKGYQESTGTHHLFLPLINYCRYKISSFSNRNQRCPWRRSSGKIFFEDIEKMHEFDSIPVFTSETAGD